MNLENFFNKLVNELKLGKLLGCPVRISGGLTHKMYKLETNNGKYIVKLLNPNIMKRPTAMNNFNKADKLEEILKQNHIPAIYSLKFNDKKMQEIDGQYFYVYEWYDGKSLKDNEIKEINCKKIGKVLAQIHNINFYQEKYERDEIDINWNYYINLAKEKNSPIYEMLYDKVDILNDSMNKSNIAIKKLSNIVTICHNDMDSKNVLWINDDFKLIDLECLGYCNPYLELYELALCWSGYETCNIDFNLFKVFIQSYMNNTKLKENIDWENLYYANYGRLEWLEFNIKRSLMIDCDTEEEQLLGINEVKETIEHVVYYYKVKDEIFDTIK